MVANCAMPLLQLIFSAATKLSLDCKVLGSGTKMMILAVTMIMIYHIDDGDDDNEACIATETKLCIYLPERASKV